MNSLETASPQENLRENAPGRERANSSSATFVRVRAMLPLGNFEVSRFHISYQGVRYLSNGRVPKGGLHPFSVPGRGGAAGNEDG